MFYSDCGYGRFDDEAKTEDIPVPVSGYWIRKNMGKDVSGEAAVLTGFPDKVLLLPVNKETAGSDNKESLAGNSVTVSVITEDKASRKKDVVVWDENRLAYMKILSMKESHGRKGKPKREDVLKRNE